MTHMAFDALLERRLELTRNVLAHKSGEYSTTEDRLHNFKRAAQLRGEPPHDALLGMLVKHWVSIEDIANSFCGRVRKLRAPDHVIDEKIGDAINYLILLEAILKENSNGPTTANTFDMANPDA
jgi:hypothetical protein